MKKYLLILGMVLGIAVFLFAFTNISTMTPKGGGDKVTICHVPPGNPANAHTITISVNAVDAHFRNHDGDYCGPCREACQPTPPCDTKPVCEPAPVCDPKPTCDPKPSCEPAPTCGGWWSGW